MFALCVGFIIAPRQILKRASEVTEISTQKRKLNTEVYNLPPAVTLA